MPIQITKLNQ